MPDNEKQNPISDVLDKLPIAQISKPSIVRMGTALGALTEAGLNLIGIPKIFEYNAKKNVELSRNLEKIATEFANDDEVVKIPVEIVQPIMERLTYCSDPNITDLFIKLLSSAGHKSTCEKAHPSLIHVIDQLSPDEAIMLQSLKGVDRLEFIEFGLENNNSGETIISEYYFSRLYEIKELTFPQNGELYMENLISLGLFTVKLNWFIDVLKADGKTRIPTPEYERLKSIAKNKVNSSDTSFEFYSKIGILFPTNKGKMFIDIATKQTTTKVS